MRFSKYPSINNHYDAKNLGWWLTRNIGLRDAKYVATEKLHGANFSVWVFPDGTHRVAKRSAFLGEADTFYHWKEAFDESTLQAFLIDFKLTVATLNRPLVLFGELFGAGVQKEVNYGIAHRIRFFDIYDPERDEYWAPAQLYDCVPEHLRVPHVGFFSGIDSALACDDAFPSLLNPVPGNTCEGVVIRPFNKTYQTETGSRFIIKKKNEKFKEKANVQKSAKTSDKLSTEVTAVVDVVMPYITSQRLSNVISHNGNPTGMEQFGLLFGLFMQDVRNECLQENPRLEDALDKKDRKTAWKIIGTHCSSMLRAYMINP